ncbi:MAG: diol dehydratase small subunit [Defluviitaleaceae bacterium]|nr:diol dehydratase small subunit [Defluviitaleaceae bacterium]
MPYPLSAHMDVVSKTGKKQSEITLEAVRSGQVIPEDIKISRETLLLQGRAARENNRPHLAHNFERAAELVDIPDELLLEMYGKLRPYRATKAELTAMADNLLNRYNAPICAKLVSDAAEIYEKRGILK